MCINHYIAFLKPGAHCGDVSCPVSSPSPNPHAKHLSLLHHPFQQFRKLPLVSYSGAQTPLITFSYRPFFLYIKTSELILSSVSAMLQLFWLVFSHHIIPSYMFSFHHSFYLMLLFPSFAMTTFILFSMHETTVLITESSLFSFLLYSFCFGTCFMFLLRYVRSIQKKV